MAIVTEFSTALSTFAAVESDKSFEQVAQEQTQLPVVALVYADEHQDKNLLLSLNFLLRERSDIVRVHAVEAGVEASISVFKKGKKVAHLTQAQGTLKERALALVEAIGWSPDCPSEVDLQNYLSPVDYHELLDDVNAFTAAQRDGTANAANVSAIIWHAFVEAQRSINWAGFYFVRPLANPKETDHERILILGPFMGKPACSRIRLQSGVCGAAALTKSVQRIADVHTFEGHIACDGASESEIVVPVFNDAGEVVAVLDLDCPRKNGFSIEDERQLVQVAKLISERSDWHNLTLPYSQHELASAPLWCHRLDCDVHDVNHVAILEVVPLLELLQITRVSNMASWSGYRKWTHELVSHGFNLAYWGAEAMAAERADALVSSVFQALRATLAAQIAAPSLSAKGEAQAQPLNEWPAEATASGSQAQRPLAGSTNALFAHIAHRHQCVHKSTQLHIEEQTKRRVTETIRRRRTAQRLVRESAIQRLQQHKTLMANDCRQVLMQAEANELQFQQHTAQIQEQATARLRSLFYECVAEIKTGVQRMVNMAIEGTDESESMERDLTKQYEWQAFLTRLEQDCARGARIVQTYLSRSEGSGDGDREPGEASLKLQANLQELLVKHGPMLAPDQFVRITNVISVSYTHKNASALQENSKASFHFGEAGSTQWVETLSSVIQMINASSKRHARRLLLRSVPLLINGEPCSELRQVVGREMLQFSGIECDILLSSSYIRWLLRSPAAQAEEATARTWKVRAYGKLLIPIDANIYFSLDEYEKNIPMLSDSPKEMVKGPMMFVQDKAMMASIQHALRFVRMSIANGQNSSNVMRTKDGIFVRASVLQLLQTMYFSANFLPGLASRDIAYLERAYPPSLIGTNVLSALYVPVADGDDSRDSESDPVKMHALDSYCIHELLLVYIARGKSLEGDGDHPTRSSSGSRQMTSIALSDALTVLYPTHCLPQQSGVIRQQCVIKNPGLLKARKEARNSDQESASDLLVIEYDICCRDQQCANKLRKRGRPLHERISPVTQSILGNKCYWRSCLDDGRSSDGIWMLCPWHETIKSYLAVDELSQYLPLQGGLKYMESSKQAPKSATVKHIIQKSSSLLDELISRQLSHSLTAFFQHVKASFSNKKFELSHTRGIDPMLLTDDPDSLQETVAYNEDILTRILASEQSSTQELNCIRQLTAYEGVANWMLDQGLLELEEFNRGIRTKDLALVLRLSIRKHDLVRARRDALTRLIAQSHARLKVKDDIIVSAQYSDHSQVDDVVHILRKSRRSLMHQHQLRPQSALSTPSLTSDSVSRETLAGIGRSNSDILRSVQGL